MNSQTKISISSMGPGQLGVQPAKFKISSGSETWTYIGTLTEGAVSPGVEPYMNLRLMASRPQALKTPVKFIGTETDAGEFDEQFKAVLVEIMIGKAGSEEIAAKKRLEIYEKFPGLKPSV